MAIRLVLSLALLIPFVSNSPASSPEIAPKIDAIFKPLISGDSPGFAVGVMRNGQPIFSSGYGLADLNTKISITPQTDFRLASVTKQFTAMAVMMLVHDGKLRYNEMLTEIFPDFPA